MFTQILDKLLSFAYFDIFAIFFYPLILVAAIILKIYEIFLKTIKCKNISGEIAVVTGAAGGLGKELSIELAKQGCHVAIVDINIEEAERTAKFIHNIYGVKTKAYKVNVTDYEQVEELNKQITQDLGIPTILVNNAGILLFKNFDNPDPREVQQMINVNLTSHFWTNRVFLSQMKTLKRGHIVAIGSILSFYSGLYAMEYGSTKFGVRSLMHSLRHALIAENYENIHTTIVYPYFLQTHKGVVDFMVPTDLNKIFPFIEGTEAAKEIVRGILQNEKEIFIPRRIAIHVRFYDILPITIKDIFAKFTFNMFLKNFREITIKQN